jgi:hypothetical protein
MATEGLRRSGRARKAVKTYAEEQAEDHAATQTKRTKRKANSMNVPDLDATKAAKKPKKVVKSATPPASPTTTQNKKTVRPKAKASKATASKTRTTSDRSWHEAAAEKRIAINNRAAKNLRPGEEEYRLREYVTPPPI